MFGLNVGEGFAIESYDSERNIVYATYRKVLNLTESIDGIIAINLDNGKIVAEIRNLVNTNEYTGNGKISISGSNPITGYLYVNLVNESGKASLLVYRLSPQSENFTFIILGSTIGTVIIIIAAASIYKKYRKQESTDNQKYHPSRK